MPNKSVPCFSINLHIMRLFHILFPWNVVILFVLLLCEFLWFCLNILQSSRVSKGGNGIYTSLFLSPLRLYTEILCKLVDVVIVIKKIHPALPQIYIQQNSVSAYQYLLLAKQIHSNISLARNKKNYGSILFDSVLHAQNSSKFLIDFVSFIDSRSFHRQFCIDNRQERRNNDLVF